MSLHRLPLRISERRALLIFVDMLINCITLLIAMYLWIWRGRSIGIHLDILYILSQHYWLFLLTLAWLVLASVNDLYDPKVTSGFIPTGWALLRTTGQLWLIYFLIYFFSPPRSLPRVVVLFYGLSSLVLIGLWRWCYILVLSHPSFQRKAVIVGAGWAGRTIARVLQENFHDGYELLGYIDDDPAKKDQIIEGLPVIGTGRDLISLAKKARVSEIILAITHQMHGDLFQAIMDCREMDVEVISMPLLYEQVLDRIPVEHLSQDWFLALMMSSKAIWNPYRLIKRGIDIVLALIGLVVLILLLPFISLAIYLDCPGPVFYRQERLGKGGRAFRLIKFRSMVPGAEREGFPQWAVECDPRITRVGKILRLTRLDELPQLINVLRGEMSFIGPRPERPEFIAQLQEQIPFYRARLAIRPGLTGWAQVKYRYGSSVEDALIKLEYDLYYIKHQSFYLDLLIFLKTIGVVFTFKGA